MKLRKAQKKKVKLKVGIFGASGFGKTYSALLMAKGMTGEWDKIGIIDTENNSADLYDDLGDYNVLPLDPPFSPEKYIEAIDVCISAGMECIIIDSITHEWSGTGGILDIKEQMGGSFSLWAKLTPRHQAFIDKILHCDAHVIATARKKQEYDMYKDERGRNKVEKKGLKNMTREGFEYEVTLGFDIINEKHYVTASKDRTGLFDGRPEFVITEETGKELMAWANSGVDEVEQMEADFKAAKDMERVKELAGQYFHLKSNPRYMAAGAEAKARVSQTQQAQAS